MPGSAVRLLLRSLWQAFEDVVSGRAPVDRLTDYAAAGAIGRARIEQGRHVSDAGAYGVLQRMRQREKAHADSQRFLRGKVSA